MRTLQQPSRDEPTTVTVPEVCPCGATYISGRHRDPVLYEAWASAHTGHGYQWERV